VDGPIGALTVAVFVFALLRFGLLAAIVTTTARQILAMGSLLDFSAWYAGMAVLPFVLVALLLVYGFRVSLAGRKLFKQES
jgi:Mn2+/Fe2+ NRAMP family transporter